MTTSRLPGATAEYQPSEAQLERARALDRFNLWAVYLPVIVVSLLVLVLLALLIWIAVINDRSRTLVSATADLLTILAIAPTLLLCALLPGLAIYTVVEGRRRDMAPLRSLQRLFWRLESLIVRVRGIVNQYAPQVARPVTRFNAWFARQETLITRLLTPGGAATVRQDRDSTHELEE